MSKTYEWESSGGTSASGTPLGLQNWMRSQDKRQQDFDKGIGPMWPRRGLAVREVFDALLASISTPTRRYESYADYVAH